MSAPLLELRRLSVAYGGLTALREIDLSLQTGETLGLVGESGSGKTTLALAVMGYLPPEGRVTGGEIRLAGRDLAAATRAELRAIWGIELALVPQDPFTSLNPALKIGAQLAEGLRLHRGLTRAEAQARAIESLREVRLPDAERLAAAYPHQLSGGQQQRVLLALALSARPRLLVLDEPTTALDVTTEATVLDLVRDLLAETGAAALYVSHNLGVVAGRTQRTAVLYASELVEDAPTAELFQRPLHPYTRGLLDSLPRPGQRRAAQPLAGMAGRIPPLNDLPPGCVFAPRCPLANEQCHAERPPLEEAQPGHRVRCHRWPEILAGTADPAQPLTATAPALARAAEPLLQLEDVTVAYPLRRTLAEVLAGQPRPAVQAVAGVDLQLGKGRTLGIVGESGSGKTSLARAIVGLAPHSGGEIHLLDLALPPDVQQRARPLLAQLQMVFQNPEEALNPYLTIGESLSRPLVNLLGLRGPALAARINELLEAVRLPAEYAARRPGQLSGGEKQRVAIARAFAARPELLVADEPVSALDVSVQASILNLLHRLQDEQGAATIFISHDIAVVAYLADDVAVMYLGRLMQTGPAAALFKPPHHPYTEALLAAIPGGGAAGVRLAGEIPSALHPPSGCPFHTRCPHSLGELCETETPPWQATANGKQIFCHIPPADLLALQPRPEARP